jgi:hypothetical protein
MEEFCGTNGILDTIMDEVQALSKLVDFLCARLCGIQPIHTKSKLRRVGQVIGANGEPNIPRYALGLAGPSNAIYIYLFIVLTPLCPWARRTIYLASCTGKPY